VDFGAESYQSPERRYKNRGLERKLPKAKKDFLVYKNRISETIHKHIRVNISHYWLGCPCQYIITTTVEVES